MAYKFNNAYPVYIRTHTFSVADKDRIRGFPAGTEHDTAKETARKQAILETCFIYYCANNSCLHVIHS